MLRVATAFVWSGWIFHLEGERAVLQYGEHSAQATEAKGKLKHQVETLEKKLEAGVAEAMERKRHLELGSPNAQTQSTRSDLSGLSASGGKKDGRLVQPHSLFEFSVSLPRACLGKMISFR